MPGGVGRRGYFPRPRGCAGTQAGRDLGRQPSDITGEGGAGAHRGVASSAGEGCRVRAMGRQGYSGVSLRNAGQTSSFGSPVAFTSWYFPPFIDAVIRRRTPDGDKRFPHEASDASRLRPSVLGAACARMSGTAETIRIEDPDGHAFPNESGACEAEPSTNIGAACTPQGAGGMGGSSGMADGGAPPAADDGPNVQECQTMSSATRPGLL
jgi:hypothetical protein